MKLHGLTRKICNGSTPIIVDDVSGNMIDTLCNLALIRGEEFDSLHKNLEDSEHRFLLLKQNLFEL